MSRNRVTFHHHSNGDQPIPLAPFYVCSTDRFMSGWGKAEGKKNVCIVPCHDLGDANLVLAYLKAGRTDQVRAAIRLTRPTYPGCFRSDLTEWIETAKRWALANRLEAQKQLNRQGDGSWWPVIIARAEKAATVPA